jgi:hypothetical protein
LDEKRCFAWKAVPRREILLYDKAQRRMEMSATVSEAVAHAIEKRRKRALPKKGSWWF